MPKTRLIEARVAVSASRIGDPALDHSLWRVQVECCLCGHVPETN